jgi:hypothetical protein
MNDAAAAAVDAAEQQVVVAAPKEKTEAEREKEKWEQEVVTDKIMLMFAFQVGGGCGGCRGCGVPWGVVGTAAGGWGMLAWLCTHPPPVRRAQKPACSPLATRPTDRGP